FYPGIYYDQRWSQLCKYVLYVLYISHRISIWKDGLCMRLISDNVYNYYFPYRPCIQNLALLGALRGNVKKYVKEACK
ncbi:MAG: hypothetical protein QM228_06555, partial [Atribacterota bacterium]|nr:hypothetical protein [Atribacterota bacterium]